MEFFRQLLYPFTLCTWLLLSVSTHAQSADAPVDTVHLLPVECQHWDPALDSAATSHGGIVDIDILDQSLIASNLQYPQQSGFQWQIDGSALDALPTGDFRDLAMPLSSPQRAIVNWCTDHCVARDVLLFGGGYDPVFDSTAQPVPRSRGNAVYMVDTTTGELLWSAGQGNYHPLILNTMQHSMTAPLSVVDSDGDCFADTVFAIDIVGNLFRFDFHNDATTPTSFASGGRIAAIGGGAHHFRRFFNAPDIALLTAEGNAPLFTIAIASGNAREQGSTLVANYLFVLFDPHVQDAPLDYAYSADNSIVTPAHLFRAGDEAVNAFGWYLPLEAPGEKAINPTVTFNDRIFLSTIIPSADSPIRQTDLSGRAYLLDALTGTSQLQLSADGQLSINREAADSSQSLPWQDLSAIEATDRPHLLVTGKPACDSACDTNLAALSTELTAITPCIGEHCLPLAIDLKLYKVFWRKQP